MRYLLSIVLLATYSMGFSQKSLLIPDTTIKIPALTFDSNGDLIIKASSTSSSKDFDYPYWKLEIKKQET